MPAVIDEHHQFTVNGKPIVNGRVYIGEANKDPKLNPITIYSDRILTLPIANPQSIDSDGRTLNKIWIPGEYSLLVEDEDNVQRYQNLDLGEPTGASAGITTLTNIQGSNAITADANNTIVEYADNETYIFKAANANTGPTTLNIDGVGTKDLVHSKNIALNLGDIKQGQTLVVIYSLTEDNFQLTNHGEVKHNPNASAPPTVNDDITLGYSVNSTWTDINNNISYICLDNNAAAAIWRVTGGILDNLSASAAPALTDDLDLGYKPGSIWVDTTNKRAYINVNNTNNLAEWPIITALYSDISLWPTVSLAADADHDITFSAGQIPDSTGTQIINLPADITKQVDIGSGWAEGNDLGGFPSGVNGGIVAINTTYHLFVIAKVNGTVDAGFDTSLTATNLLADATDYTVYKRIASRRTDGAANWEPFIQFGDEFLYPSKFSSITTTAPPSTPTLISLDVPTGISVKAKIMGTASGGGTGSNTGGWALLFSSGLLSAGIAASASTSSLISNHAYGFTSVGTASYDSYELEILTDTSGRIYVDSDKALGTGHAINISYTVGVLGYVDPRID